MALLPILKYPDPRLRIHAKPVSAVDARVQQLVDDLFETMYAASGIGLAATQVDVHERVVVMDVAEDKSEPRVFINPEIVERAGEATGEEGCLSVPGAYEHVKRAQRIRVRALDRDGRPYELAAEGLLAVCIQHELDHLEGRLFVDRLSTLKRQRVRKRLADGGRSDDARQPRHAAV